MLRRKTPLEKRLAESAKRSAKARKNARKGPLKQRLVRGARVAGVVAGIGLASFGAYKTLDYAIRADAKAEMSKRSQWFREGTMPKNAFVREMTSYLPEALKKTEKQKIVNSLQSKLGRKPTRKEQHAAIEKYCREKAEKLADELERERPVQDSNHW